MSVVLAECVTHVVPRLSVVLWLKLSDRDPGVPERWQSLESSVAAASESVALRRDPKLGQFIESAVATLQAADTSTVERFPLPTRGVEEMGLKARAFCKRLSMAVGKVSERLTPLTLPILQWSTAYDRSECHPRHSEGP